MVDVLDLVVARQAQVWMSLAAVCAVALVLRIALPAQRRALRLTWVLALLSALAFWAGTQAMSHPQLVALALGLASVLGGLAIAHLATGLVFRVALRALGLQMPRIAHDLTFTALALAWGFFWLRLLGVDPTQLFATSAVITAVLAFSMQDTLGNVLGGVTLQLDNSLRVGDWVRLDDVSGRVTDVHWRFTSIETRNRELVMVPNSWLMKNRFTVIRGSDDALYAWRRAVQFSIEPNASPDTVIAALEHAVKDAEIAHVLKDPPPSAILFEVAAGYCRYVLRYWLSDPRQDDPTDSAVRVHALAALARAGIRLGVPQEERLMIKENENWRTAADHKEMARRVDAIRSTVLFANLPVEEQQALAAHLVHAPFAAGDIITSQGNVAHWLYLIIRGEAKVLMDSPKGRIQISTLRDGAFFGEMGMLTGEPRSATVVAVTAVDCYRLDKAGFAQILEKRPEIAQEMSAILEARNRERQALLDQAGTAANGHGDVLGRILQFFSVRG